MGIDLIGTIQPKNNAAFPTHDAKYGKGGFQSVVNLATRDAIPDLNRVAGMHVYVLSNLTTYVLGVGLTNSDWLLGSNLPIFTASDIYIDPINGNDNNSGLTSITALKTHAELYSRTRGAIIFPPSNDPNLYGARLLTVHILNNLLDTDPINIECVLGQDAIIHYVGGATTLHSGSITSVVARDPSNNIPFQFTDSALPTSNEWATYLGKRVRITSATSNLNTTMWVAKDLGAKTFRSSDPSIIAEFYPARIADLGILSFLVVDTYPQTPIVGDTYVVEDLRRVAPGLIKLDAIGSGPGGWIPQIVFSEFDFATSDEMTIIAPSSIPMFNSVRVAAIFNVKEAEELYPLNCYFRTGIFNKPSSAFTQLFGGLIGAITDGAENFGLYNTTGRLALVKDVMCQGVGIRGGNIIIQTACIFDAIDSLFSSASGVDVGRQQVHSSNPLIIPGAGITLGRTENVSHDVNLRLWGSGNAGYGVNVSPGCVFECEVIPTITGALGNFSVGSGTSARGWDQFSGTYASQVPATWANLGATLRAGGLGGSAFNPALDARIIAINSQQSLQVNGNTITYRPGVASGGNHVATWSEVNAFIAANSGACTVYLDGSIAACTVSSSANTECFSLTKFVAVSTYGESLIINDGGRLRNPNFFDFVVVTHTSTATIPLIFDAGLGSELTLTNNAQLKNGGAVPCATFVTNAFVYVDNNAGFDINLTPSVPIIDVQAGITAIITVRDTTEHNFWSGPSNASNLFRGTATSLMTIAHDDSISFFAQSLFPIGFSEERTSLAAMAQPSSGVTLGRPTKPFLGEMYFDTTLGTAVWWNGASWVSPSGGATPAGSAGEIQINNGIGGLGAATNVKGGSGFISIGINPASNGDIRLQNGSSIKFRDAGNTSDVPLISTTGLNIVIGNNALVSSAELWANSSFLWGTASAGIYTTSGSGYALRVLATKIEISLPVVGAVSNPYGVHGVGAVAMADTNQTVATTVYVFNTIKTTGALTANRNLVLPAATDIAGYTKIINNTCTGAFSVVVGDGGVGTTVAVANGTTITVLFDSRGATQVGIAASGATITPGGANTQIQFNDSGVFGGNTALTFNKATGLVSLTNSVAFGATPAAAGAIRLTNASGARSRNAAGSADITIYETDASNQLFIGSNSAYGLQAAVVRVQSVSGGVLGTTTANSLEWGSASVITDVPLLTGSYIQGNSSPYGVHGNIGIRAPSDADYTLTSTEYTYAWIEADLVNWTTNHRYVFPVPAGGRGYFKTFYNTSTLRSVTVSIDTSGTLLAVSVAATQAQLVWIDSTGVRKGGTPFSP
jgi:hypothetical protein